MPKKIITFAPNFYYSPKMIKLFRKKEDKFSYIEQGQGTPLLLLHGLMGGLSNFDAVVSHFSQKYRVLVPELPLYDLPILSLSVKVLASWVERFLVHKELTDVIVLGNSLGGHVALVLSRLCPSRVKALVLTGSSGLYENQMGAGYLKRNNKEYIRQKCEETFYDPATASPEIVDAVFAIASDRTKTLMTLAVAKSAIRHNMAKELPDIKQPVCLIWGKQDIVTPPEVAQEFHSLLPHSWLYWIDQCGHAPMMERPMEFNALLQEWLEEQRL